MGNSGSVHHMQSGLKELHSYYHVQTNGEAAEELAYLNENEPKSFHMEAQKCLEREKSLPRSKFSRIPSHNRNTDRTDRSDIAGKNSQIKVLPNLTENLRLRSTTNGAILQSGGTISGRKETLLPQPMGLERSKTFITENSGESIQNAGAARGMPRRSQTQISIDLRKRNAPNPLSRNQFQTTNNAQYRRFDAETKNDTLETDLNASVCNSSETYQKLSKVKIKNKKRKAPPVPPSSVSEKAQDASSSIERQAPGLNHRETETKQRLFKTKSETILKASYTRQQPVKGLHNPNPPANPRLPYKPKSSATTISTTYRREKSFDATLLSSRNKEDTSSHMKTSTTTKRKSLQLTTGPSSLLMKNDFKIELEAATKFRLNAREASSRQREPNNDKPKPVKMQTPPPRNNKPETQSKIPQLKKTFYFGMENSKRKPPPVDSSQKPNTSEEKTTSKEEILPTSAYSSNDGDPVYALNHKYSSEVNDNGIQVNVRPMLPRRQLEIPRFSPVAAWRTLSEEFRRQALDPAGSPLSSMFAIEAANTFLIEDRIYRTYREPCPFYPDNKSGDSGISGDDAYLPEKPIQPRNNLMDVQNDYNLDGYPVDDPSQPLKVVGPFLAPWTPQQDLEEEDTSSDGDLAIKLLESQSPTATHVFSLSLPRENQLSVYGEKSKPEFRSLQKLKRSVSGELNGSGCECVQSSASNLFGNVGLGNYRSDNWVLSKTGWPLNNDQSVVACGNPVDSSKENTYLDLSLSIQPMSLGCLATGKHVMYLPNRPINEPPTDAFPNKRDNLDESFSKNTRQRNKRFSFQSSVRQIERRRLADKLSKEAEQKEALRISELEAMRRVEEEFQRKRAYEKASIRHQLRLYSMDDDNFTSLPAEYSRNCAAFRAEPDGAVSSTSVSPILRANDSNEDPMGRDIPSYIPRSSNKIANDIAMVFANS